MRFALANAVWVFHKAQIAYTTVPYQTTQRDYFNTRADMISIDVSRAIMYGIPRCAEEEDPFPRRGPGQWM